MLEVGSWVPCERRRVCDITLTDVRQARLGIILFVVSNGLTAAVDAFAKYMSAQLQSVQIGWGFFLMFFVFIVGYSVARARPLKQVLQTDHLVMQLVRSGTLILTITLLFIGIAFIPFADAIAIAFMAPLFIMILAVPVLGETFSWYRLFAVLLGLGGVAIIIQPGVGVLHWAAFMPLGAGLFFALFQIMTRRLAATEDWFTTLFYTAAGGLAWISLSVAFFWRPLTLEHIGIFTAMGLLGASAHWCIVKALGAAEASLLAPFNYTKLIWAAVIGYVFFGETPSLATAVGGLVIVLSGLFVLYRER